MIRYFNSEIEPKIIVLIGDDKFKGQHLYKILEYLDKIMIEKLSKNDELAKLFLTDNFKAINGTLLWSEHDETSNCIISKLDDKVYNSLKCRKLLIKSISNICQQNPDLLDIW